MKPRIRRPGDLAKLLGVRVERRPKTSPIWDGRAINIQVLNEHGYVHELMHWLLATPFRRSRENFGHGGAAARATMDWEKCRREEALIGVMTRACLRLMQMSEGGRRPSAEEEEGAVAELRKRGLMDAQRRPVLPGLTYDDDDRDQGETTMATTTVKAKCIGCSATREIGPGEIAPGDQPMCTKCGMPMIAAGATTKTESAGRTPRPGGKKARLARGAKAS